MKIEVRYIQNGEVPTLSELQNDPDAPSPTTYYRRFDSYNEAVRKAGLNPNPSGGQSKISREELLNYLKEEAEELEGTPPAIHFAKDKSLPSPSTYKNEFESWNNALREAGLELNAEKEHREIPDEMREEIYEVWLETDKTMTALSGEFEVCEDVVKDSVISNYENSEDNESLFNCKLF